MHVVVIDNYDSFTYNIVQLLGELECDVEVFRNDAVTVSALKRRKPSALVISPGPGTPLDAGISCQVLTELSPRIPTFGVCLGHQCLGYAYGGQVVRAPRLMHGKVSRIYHDDHTVFRGLPNPFEATRYHSLVVQEEGLPACLRVSAWTRDGEVMGLRHVDYPIEGVQFHPESVLTQEGRMLLLNFLRRAGG